MPLAAIVALGYCLAASASMSPGLASAQSTTITVDRDTMRASRDGHDLVIYRQSPNAFKTYVEQWYSPAGAPLLLDHPPDHGHHHGLMFGLGANDCDFWQERLSSLDPRSPRRVKTIGRQRPRSGSSAKVMQGKKGDRIVIQQAIDWLAAEPRLLTEERRIEIADVSDPVAARVLSWQSRLTNDPGEAPVDLWGTHYYGLGMRVAPADGPAKFASADGGAGEKRQGSERLRKGNWCSYSAKRGGQDLTLVFFDDPDNPRPATWFTMDSPFTYLSATLGLNDKALRVAAGETVQFRYGLAVADRALSAAEIESLRSGWLEAKADSK
jgi:Family of unknown function (DUF6807)